LTICRNLEYFTLTSNFLIDGGLETIASSCPALSEINLIHCHEISASGIEAVLEKCQNLSLLCLKDCIHAGIEILGVARLKHIKLTTLNLEGIICLSSDAIGERSPNLHSLNLRSHFTTNARLAPVINKMLNLRFIYLNGCHRIKDEEVSSIKE